VWSVEAAAAAEERSRYSGGMVGRAVERRGRSLGVRTRVTTAAEGNQATLAGLVDGSVKARSTSFSGRLTRKVSALWRAALAIAGRLTRHHEACLGAVGAPKPGKRHLMADAGTRQGHEEISRSTTAARRRAERQASEQSRVYDDAGRQSCHKGDSSSRRYAPPRAWRSAERTKFSRGHREAGSRVAAVEETCSSSRSTRYNHHWRRGRAPALRAARGRAMVGCVLEATLGRGGYGADGAPLNHYSGQGGAG
jgi:hypothetical protein